MYFQINPLTKAVANKQQIGFLYQRGVLGMSVVNIHADALINKGTNVIQSVITFLVSGRTEICLKEDDCSGRRRGGDWCSNNEVKRERNICLCVGVCLSVCEPACVYCISLDTFEIIDRFVSFFDHLPCNGYVLLWSRFVSYKVVRSLKFLWYWMDICKNWFEKSFKNVTHVC